VDANELQEKAKRSEATAREALRRLTDETLSVTWLATEVMPMSEELAVTRGWLMDELEARMGVEKFDAWVFANSNVVDPLPYLGG
jgi:hypothetical protein